MLPIPVGDVSVPVSAVTPSVGEPFPVSSVVLPDLSREGPFDVDQTASGAGATPRVLERGCQYRMTSYDAADWTRRMDYIYMTLNFSSMSARPSRLTCSAEHRTIGYTI